MIYSDAHLQEIFDRTRVLAIVGASANPARPSHYVGQFLRRQGYRVIAVNSGLAGQQMFGEEVYASLGDIPKEIAVDFVDVFRRSDYVAQITDDALTHLPQLRTIWMQLGVIDEDAALKAEAAGIDVVMNRCPMIELPRLRRLGTDVG